MPQAIKLIDAEGRSCIYVSITQDGRLVDSHGFALDAEDDCAPRRCGLRREHHRAPAAPNERTHGPLSRAGVPRLALRCAQRFFAGDE
jgi:hypothetical protein